MINLPKELWIIIFKYLETRSLIRFSIANKTTKKIFSDCLSRLSIDCSYKDITDGELKHLKGVHTIDLWMCKQITDKGLSYLKGVHTIDLKCCEQITDKGLSYLKGVHTIDLRWCKQITDKGLSYLKGVRTIYFEHCNKITIKGIQCLNPEFIGMRFLRTITSQ